MTKLLSKQYMRKFVCKLSISINRCDISTKNFLDTCRQEFVSRIFLYETRKSRKQLILWMMNLKPKSERIQKIF